MELALKIEKVLEPMSGTSKKDGSQWVKNIFVGVVQPEGQYQKRIVLTVFGEDRWKQFGIVEGGIYQVGFDIDAREYNGRWYNDLSAWKAVRTDAPQTQAQVQQHAQKPSPAPAQNNAQEADLLPF